MEVLLKGYYKLIDATQDFPEWQRKIEEVLGQNVAFMAIGFDESVRN